MTPVDKTQRFISQQSPIPRMGAVPEPDGALLLLASRASTFITGQSLVGDGAGPRADGPPRVIRGYAWN
jgi:hypothetical protein